MKAMKTLMKSMKSCKGVKKDMHLKKKKSDTSTWAPSGDDILITPRSFMKGWRAERGQFKMLKADLEAAWIDHRDYKYHNKSFGCGAEAFKTFFGYIISLVNWV